MNTVDGAIAKEKVNLLRQSGPITASTGQIRNGEKSVTAH
jgi:hypothetical protein